jgi:hypothetical protein
LLIEHEGLISLTRLKEQPGSGESKREQVLGGRWVGEAGEHQLPEPNALPSSGLHDRFIAQIERVQNGLPY